MTDTADLTKARMHAHAFVAAMTALRAVDMDRADQVSAQILADWEDPSALPAISYRALTDALGMTVPGAAEPDGVTP